MGDLMLVLESRFDQLLADYALVPEVCTRS